MPTPRAQKRPAANKCATNRADGIRRIVRALLPKVLHATRRLVVRLCLVAYGLSPFAFRAPLATALRIAFNVPVARSHMVSPLR